MAGDVNPRRRYRSDRRQEATRETAERVLAAARELFEARGYDAASIAAIAERAGVSAETVYARFGSKRVLLGELVQRAARGDDPAPIGEQRGPRALAASRDQRQQVRLFAADVARRLERVGPIAAVAAGAARSDPELAALLRRLHEDRLRTLRLLVSALARNGPLRLPEAQAVETVWAIASPELHQLLTATRGWSRRRYVAWLERTLTALLLLPEAGP